MLVVALLLLASWYFADPRESAPVDAGDPSKSYVVARVVDGDTLLLAGGERVRLLGVDTPETVAPDRPVEPFGPEASAFTERMAEGRAVTLGYDKERRDRYGRTLAYVYVDGRMLNEEILRAGLSEAQLQYPYANAMKKRFKAAEEEARRAGRGMWSAAAGRSSRPQDEE